MDKNNEEIIIVNRKRHPTKSSLKIDQYVNYDYYKNPADLKEAKFHKECNRFGPLENGNKNLKTCPCCYNKYISKRLSMNDSDEKFAEVNPTIAIYFKFLKFSMLVLFLNFVLSGIVILIKYKEVRNCFIINCEFDDSIIYEIYRDDIISKVMVIINFIVLIVLKLGYIYKLRQFDILQQSQRVTASHFTLNVRYPINMTEQELDKEFTNLKKGWKVVKINLVYDINKYTTILGKIINLKKTIIYLEHKNKEDTRKYKNLIVQLAKNNDILDKLQKNYEKCESAKFLTGFAFITMNKESSMHEIINFYNEPLNLIHSHFRKFRIKRAYEPIDIIWENYGLSKWQSYTKRFTTNILTLGLIGGLFTLCIIIREIQLQYQGDFSLSNITLAATISIFISLANILLRVVLKIFTKFERHRNYTTLYNKVVQKISLAYFVNIGLMVNFTHIIINKEWIFWGKLSVSINITFFMIISIFVDGLYDLVDPLYIIQKIKRVIIRSKLKRKKAVLQCEANKAYEGIEVDIPERYYQSMKVLSICFFFQPIIPYILLVGLVEQICTYYVQKYVITRRVVRPKNLDFKFSLTQVEHFEFCMTAMILGYINFDIIFSGGFSKFTFVLICLGSFHFLFNDFDIFTPFFGSYEKNDDIITYDESKKFFATDYDRMNPVTQKDAYIKWINFLKNKPESKKSRKSSLLGFTSGFTHKKNLNLNINTFNQTMYDYLEYKNVSKIGDQRFNKNIMHSNNKNLNDINLFLIEDSADKNLQKTLYSKAFNLNSKLNKKKSQRLNAQILTNIRKRHISDPNTGLKLLLSEKSYINNNLTKNNSTKSFNPNFMNKNNLREQSSHKSFNPNFMFKNYLSEKSSYKSSRENSPNSSRRNSNSKKKARKNSKFSNKKKNDHKNPSNNHPSYHKTTNLNDIKINIFFEGKKLGDSKNIEEVSYDRGDYSDSDSDSFNSKKNPNILKKNKDSSDLTDYRIKEEKEEDDDYLIKKKFDSYKMDFANSKYDGISIIKEESEDEEEIFREDKGNIEPFGDLDFYDDNIKLKLKKVYFEDVLRKRTQSHIPELNTNKQYFDFKKANSGFY